MLCVRYQKEFKSGEKKEEKRKAARRKPGRQRLISLRWECCRSRSPVRWEKTSVRWKGGLQERNRQKHSRIIFLQG